MQLNFVPSYEGAEKTLVVDFCLAGKISSEIGNGLLDIEASVWEQILIDCKCHILNSQRSKEIASYTHTGSSLFVLRHKIIFKTFGKGKPLNAVPHLFQIAKDMGTSIEFVNFCHTDFISPMHQHTPLPAFQQDILFLNNHFPLGKWLSFGPPQGHFGSKWHVFVADNTKKNAVQRPELTLEIHMSGLDPGVMQLFADSTDKQKAELSRTAAIGSLLPGFTRDEHFFEPGYCMNAIDAFKSYASIHVIPGPDCSYVSFETNASGLDLAQIVNTVLLKFRPQNATVVTFSDDAILSTRTQTDYAQMTSGSFEKFETSQVSTHCFVEGFTISLMHLRRTYSLPVIQKSKPCLVDASHQSRWQHVQSFLPEACPVFPVSIVTTGNMQDLLAANCLFSATNGSEAKAAIQISATLPIVMVNSCKTKGQLLLAAANNIAVTFQVSEDLVRIGQHCNLCPVVFDAGVLSTETSTRVLLEAHEKGLNVAGLRVTIDDTVTLDSVVSLSAVRQQLAGQGHELKCVHVCLKKVAQLTPALMLGIKQATVGTPLFVDCAPIEPADATF
eukprot:c15027_g1_i1.p1 GENE.c15027_g1_i1~~c15027_g1_i1.p1  ORF type:complete len:558 (+),score=89.15 c15027_g1_i1:316-1989(+)